MPTCFNLTEVIVAVVSAIAVSSLVSVKIVKRNSNNQNRNFVGSGDIVGRDKTGGNRTNR